MTYRHLLLLCAVLAACVDDDDDSDDTDLVSGTDTVDGTSAEPTLDEILCERAENGPFENYNSGQDVDSPDIVDLDGQAASVAVAGNGGFVGFEPTRAGAFTFGRSLDARLQVIDRNGREPEFVEDVRDIGCLEVQVRSTYVLEVRRYLLLLDGGVPFITLVGEYDDEYIDDDTGT